MSFEQDMKIKEEASTVFEVVIEGIYKVIKDKNENFSGAYYVGLNEVINELNMELKTAIVSRFGTVFHKNF